MSIECHFKLSDDIKKRWVVKKDSCGDEYIALSGRNSLGNGGRDHIYLSSENAACLWASGIQIRQKISHLQKKLPTVEVKQIGDKEAIISVPIYDLDLLCAAAKAKKRRKFSEKDKQRLISVGQSTRFQKDGVKTGSDGPKKAKQAVRAVS